MVTLALLFRPSDPTGDQLLRPEVVKNQLPMLAERAGNLLHGLDAGSVPWRGREWRRRLYHNPALDPGSPSRLDKLRPLFGEIAQDFNERFREEARRPRGSRGIGKRWATRQDLLPERWI
jgi:hypothetical protein